MKLASVAAFCLIVACSAAHAAGTAFPWPNGARAAVSLAYDDALGSQLDNAIPALDHHGLRGSFYLTLANPSLGDRLPEWRDAAAHGHELGNHTLFHRWNSVWLPSSWPCAAASRHSGSRSPSEGLASVR